MGRSGDVGRDIGLVYDKLRDKNQVEKLLANFSTSLVKQTHHWQWIQWLEAKGLAWLLDVIFDHIASLERNRPEAVLSSDALSGLHWYLEVPLLEQFRIENKQMMPPDITVLFGHTHKPFQQEMQFVGFPQNVRVYNSGGWVVDQLVPTPIYGAAAVLIDEQLQTTSLRMYNQAASPKDYAVRVEEATRRDGASNPFHERIKSLVNPERDPWRAFSDTVAEAVRVHAQVLQTKINM
jgi:hypothetical protein